MIRTASLFPLLLLIFMSACVSPQLQTPPVNSDEKATQPDLPIDLRISGSSTLGERLVPELLKGFITSRGGRDLEWINDGAPGIRRLWVRDGGNARVPRHISIELGKSSTAFQALKDGQADIGMSSRVISARELVSLASVGDFKNGRSEHVIALDGLAVIVNAANPVKELSVEQITRIFSCRTTDWLQVKGISGTITIYSSEDGAEIQEVLETLAPPFQGLLPCVVARRVAYPSKLSQAVAADPNGIAIVSLQDTLGVRAVDVVECDGTSYGPDAFSVRSREYPLTRPLYLYTPVQPSSPFVHDLIDFILSPEGQEIVHQEKFACLAVRPDVIDPQDRRLKEATLSVQDAAMLGELIDLTRKASRLAVTFRFESRDRLDELGRSDLDRLARFMATPAAQGKELMLLGFADGDGRYRDSLDRSRSRAETVARALREKGVNVNADLVRGFGEEAPVACNSDESGKARNRRVEVWIR